MFLFLFLVVKVRYKGAKTTLNIGGEKEIIRCFCWCRDCIHKKEIERKIIKRKKNKSKKLMLSNIWIEISVIEKNSSNIQ